MKRSGPKPVSGDALLPTVGAARSLTMGWQDAIDWIRPHVFKISTPGGFGTGFLISHSKDRQLCGIATAAHVIAHANYWEQPIRLEHHTSGNLAIVRQPERAVCADPARDTAVILCASGAFQLPEQSVPLIGEDRYLRLGNEVGWVGFPAISDRHLCFFSGKASCWIQEEHAYLVDGVAINGVSGGPTFHLRGDHARVI